MPMTQTNTLDFIIKKIKKKIRALVVSSRIVHLPKFLTAPNSAEYGIIIPDLIRAGTLEVFYVHSLEHEPADMPRI